LVIFLLTLDTATLESLSTYRPIWIFIYLIIFLLNIKNNL
jgi:hypothetical protein